MVWFFEDEVAYLSNLREGVVKSLKKIEKSSDGIGYIYTRNPYTGNNVFYGEYSLRRKNYKNINILRLENLELYNKLVEISKELELNGKDMQKIEFLIHGNEIEIVSAKAGEKSAKAAIKISVDLVEEEVLSIKEALKFLERVNISKNMKNVLKNGFAPKNEVRNVEDNINTLYLMKLSQDFKRILFWADTYKVALFEN